MKTCEQYYQLAVYIPKTHVDIVKAALFAAGAGKIGQYDCCCFTISGRGEFRPRPGSNPFIGTSNRTTYVDEEKVEMIFPESVKTEVIAALRKSHPYEEPAFHYFPVAIN